MLVPGTFVHVFYYNTPHTTPQHKIDNKMKLSSQLFRRALLDGGSCVDGGRTMMRKWLWGYGAAYDMTACIFCAEHGTGHG